VAAESNLALVQVHAVWVSMHHYLELHKQPSSTLRNWLCVLWHFGINKDCGVEQKRRGRQVSDLIGFERKRTTYRLIPHLIFYLSASEPPWCHSIFFSCSIGTFRDQHKSDPWVFPRSYYLIYDITTSPINIKKIWFWKLFIRPNCCQSQTNIISTWIELKTHIYIILWLAMDTPDK
jgi:hypothetical protein